MAAQRVRVAAGILVDRNDRVLIAERLGDDPLSGYWEFPGGKCERGESREDALRRELREELGIEAGAARSFITLKHDYPDRRVSIEFFLVENWSGEPTGECGQRLRWCRREDLNAAELLPADAPVLRALCELSNN